jgi:hypothetical protein
LEGIELLAVKFDDQTSHIDWTVVLQVIGWWLYWFASFTTTHITARARPVFAHRAALDPEYHQ